MSWTPVVGTIACVSRLDEGGARVQKSDAVGVRDGRGRSKATGEMAVLFLLVLTQVPRGKSRVETTWMVARRWWWKSSCGTVRVKLSIGGGEEKRFHGPEERSMAARLQLRHHPHDTRSVESSRSGDVGFGCVREEEGKWKQTRQPNVLSQEDCGEESLDNEKTETRGSDRTISEEGTIAGLFGTGGT